MKMKLIVSLMLVSAVASAAAKKGPAACDKIRAKADAACVELMCGEGLKDGTYKNENECRSASDYGEAAQETCSDTLSDATTEYNQKHGTHIHCKE